MRHLVMAAVASVAFPAAAFAQGHTNPPATPVPPVAGGSAATGGKMAPGMYYRTMRQGEGQGSQAGMPQKKGGGSGSGGSGKTGQAEH